MAIDDFLCIPCTTVAPDYPTACEVTRAPGGIRGFGYIKCGQTTFATIEDPAEWITKKTAGNLRSTLMENIIGSVPDPAASMKKFGSCTTEEVNNIVHTWQFQDFNANVPPLFKQDVFYEFYNKNYRLWVPFIVRCDDVVWIANSAHSFSATRLSEEDGITGNTVWNTKIMFPNRIHPTSVYVPGLANALSA